ncbi:hypothetical protein BN2476_500121 [Paraburkholderia piptadeniae]|uniref:DUF3363 domain-containing protein n=1 Tax=Paraburkholderia piptadeniae TaxID=1701573 RepID=A0A1N7SFQ7_9BURK|nr:hypothetical protein BN2476_500121 [Paraburkholderia piptadeniae]
MLSPAVTRCRWAGSRSHSIGWHLPPFRHARQRTLCRMGFSLVPWKPVIEQQSGRQIAATVSGGGVSWEIGRRRGMSVG